jgi:hypothetical protein
MATKEMNARFPGTCRACGGPIAAGDVILYGKPEGASHKVCPAPKAGGFGVPGPANIPAEAVVNVVVGRRSKPTKDSDVGRVFRAEDNGLIVRVLAQTAVFIPEDGESLGLPPDMDRGWRLTLHCRRATPEEAASIDAAERAEAEAAAHDRALEKARRTLFAPQDGECVTPPEGASQMRLEGTRVKWREGFNIYGGGEELVVDEDGKHIWWVVNNGHDGDCWAESNVMTGGAGAIGRRYPATPERLAFVRGLPGGEYVGLTPAEQRTKVVRVYRAQIGAVRAEFAGLFDEEPLDAVSPLPAVWVELDDSPRGALVGMTPNGAHVYLAVSYAMNGPSPYDHNIHCRGDGRVYLEYPATPARIAAIRALWPGWVGTSARGRYIIHTALGGTCENAAEALVLAHQEKMPITAVEETAGAQIVYASPGVVELKAGVLLWSDGAATRVRACGFHSRLRHDPRRDPWRTEQDQVLAAAGFPAPPAPEAWSMTLAPAADELLWVALRQEDWQQDRRFERLFTVVGTERTRVDHRGEIVPGRSSDEVELLKLTVRHKDGREEPFWLVHGSWVDIGEDADAGDDYALFDRESLARDKYRTLYS